MAQSVYLNRLNTEIGVLRREVRTLRSFLISVIGQDQEGVYRPRFVEEILRAAKEKPSLVFRDARSFLAELKRV